MNITEQINLTEIAASHQISPFYLNKLFHSVTGENIGAYIRNRKLCRAADDLLHTDYGVVDLAFEYGYSTHEAFSRAFKKYFGLSPYRYRQRKTHPHFLTKKKLDIDELKNRIENIALTPSIITCSPVDIMGISYSTFINNSEVYSYYEEFLGLITNVTGPASKKIYTIYPNDPTVDIQTLTDETNYTIIIGIERNALQGKPSGMKDYNIPEAQYAVFNLGSNIAAAGDTYLFIYNSWLPSSPYKLAGSADYLTSELDSTNNITGLSIYIPVTG